MISVLTGLAVGLAVGAFNFWLIRGASRGGAASLKSLGWRMVVRNLANVAALFVVYMIFRDQWAILTTLFGLLIFPTVTVIQLYFEGRARR